MAPFYGWCSTASRPEPLRLNSLVCRVSGRSSILLEMQIMLIKYKKFSLC